MYCGQEGSRVDARSGLVGHLVRVVHYSEIEETEAEGGEERRGRRRFVGV